MLDFHSARPPWLDFADPFYYSKGGRKVAMNISGPYLELGRIVPQ